MKKLFITSALTLLIATLTWAQKEIPLYNGPAPGSESWTWSEAVNEQNSWKTRVVYNVTKPTLTVFAPDAAKSNGTALVICPGGGFYGLAIDNEGLNVAKWLVEKGVTCFVLKYRLIRTMGTDPTAEFTAALGKKEFQDATSVVIPLAVADGRTAIQYVRSHAAEYNIEPNRVGIMGFSAGGTVAASTLYQYSKENRPDFAAPIYPFFPAAMRGTVASDAPPLFIVTATDDGFGLAPHSVDLYSQWLSAKHDAELHMYARGNHGFGTRTQNLPTDQWLDRFTDWLGVLGLTKKRDTTFDPYQKKEFVLADGKVLPYRMLLPDHYDKTKKYPLLLFLHGAGERGNDNEKQLVHGAKLFLNEESRKSFQAILLFPQCPEESSWGSYKVDRTKTPYSLQFDYMADATWPLTAANELVKKVSAEESVDKSRVYIAGLSMGGMGTFESVYRYPALYAAALPICGGGDVAHYDNRIKKTAFWVFHGDADPAVDVKLSREMVEKLKKIKAEVKYTEYPGVQHNSWDNAFAEPAFLSWMLLHKRK